MAVIDGKEGAEYDVIDDLSFTAGGRHVLYHAVNLRPTEAHFLVVDGVAGSVFDGIGEVVSSDDGMHVAFSGKRAGGQILVVDGVESKPYPMLSGLMFSPDGQRVACVVTEYGVDRLLLDGALGPEFGGISGCRFSPDSRHVVHWGSSNRGRELWAIVVDGQAGGEYAGAVTGFRFESANSFSTIAWMNSTGSGLHLYRLNGRIGERP